MNPTGKLIINKEIFTKLQAIIGEITGNDAEEMSPNTDFSDDLSMSPMEFAQMVARVEELFPTVSLTKKDFEEIETIGDLVVFIEEELE